MDPKRQITALFVGLGSIGTRHLKNLHNLCTDRSVGYLFYKVFYDFKVYVRLKQRKFNLTHCVFKVFFADLAHTSELFECILKLIRKTFKCHSRHLCFP